MPVVPIYFQRESSATSMSPAIRTSSNATSPQPPHPPITPHKPQPLLRFSILDLQAPGTKHFLSTCDPTSLLTLAVDAVIQHLYPSLDPQWQEVRSITLILDPMDGVAYTRGIELDDAHKEIHLSMSYIKHIHDSSKSRLKAEIEGVMVHEMVHVWQHDGKHTAPVGLTEGVADWVRLQAGFAPPHWRRDFERNWDAGYQHTAYFLEWIEMTPKVGGRGSVRRINMKLRDCAYDEGTFWKELFGKSVDQLWEMYKLENQGVDGKEAAEATMTCDVQDTKTKTKTKTVDEPVATATADVSEEI